jgi:hypothetical protein
VEAAPEVLEWFRVDRSRSTGWLLAGGVALVFVGALLVAAGFATHDLSGRLHAVTLVGAGLLVTGLVTAFGGLTVLLAHDEYLAVRVDGVFLHRTSGDTLFQWTELTSVAYDPEARAIIFQSRGEPPAVLRDHYSRAASSELARYLDELRRKTTLGPIDAAQVGLAGFVARNRERRGRT